MNKSKKILTKMLIAAGLVAPIVAPITFLSSCTGQQGPKGDKGDPGKDGVDSKDGEKEDDLAYKYENEVVKAVNFNFNSVIDSSKFVGTNKEGDGKVENSVSLGKITIADGMKNWVFDVVSCVDFKDINCKCKKTDGSTDVESVFTCKVKKQDNSNVYDILVFFNKKAGIDFAFGANNEEAKIELTGSLTISAKNISDGVVVNANAISAAKPDIQFAINKTIVVKSNKTSTN